MIFPITKSYSQASREVGLAACRSCCHSISERPALWCADNRAHFTARSGPHSYRTAGTIHADSFVYFPTFSDLNIGAAGTLVRRQSSALYGPKWTAFLSHGWDDSRRFFCIFSNFLAVDDQ